MTNGIHSPQIRSQRPGLAYDLQQRSFAVRQLLESKRTAGAFLIRAASKKLLSDCMHHLEKRLLF